MSEPPYIVGALYNRLSDIHGMFGGQQRGGISTPTRGPFLFIFTGEAGKEHGYSDFWDDYGVFHYFGEGQRGDMRMAGGNSAIANHIKNGKRLLLFQMMGKSRPCRFLGEYFLADHYEQPDIVDRERKARTAIVFKLLPIETDQFGEIGEQLVDIGLDSTTITRSVLLRRKQDLFRRRLIRVEKECRLTGIRDLRFVRASHIKPWAACTDGAQRIDGNNGLLLTPSADHLFDRGWISFDEGGRLLRSRDLTPLIADSIGLDIRPGRPCGKFKPEQQIYMDYHRSAVFESCYASQIDPVKALLTAIGET